jgi:hypothetical protein
VIENTIISPKESPKIPGRRRAGLLCRFGVDRYSIRIAVVR